MAGLLLTGLLAAGLLDPLPPFARFSVALLLFTALAGAVARPLLLRSGSVFLLGLAIFSVVTWCFWLFDTTFSAYVVGVQTFALAYFGFFFLHRYFHRRRRSGDSGSIPRVETGQPSGSAKARGHWWSTSRWVGGMAMLVGLSFYVIPPALPYAGDAFDHIGYVRAIRWENGVAPDGVLAPDGEAAARRSADPRKGTFHPLLAMVCYVSNVDPATGWRWLPVWLAPVFVLTFYRFACAFLPSGAQRSFALLAFLVSAGGFGRNFLANVGYGQNLSLAFWWMLLTVTVAEGRSPNRLKLFTVLVLVVGAGMIHAGAVVHFGLALVSLVVFPRAFGLTRRGAVRLTTVWALGCSVVVVWRVLAFPGTGNPLHTHPQGLLYVFDMESPYFVPSPVEILRKHSLVFLSGLVAVVCLPFVRRYRNSAYALLALSLPPILVAVNPWVAPRVYEHATYMLHRMLLNVPAILVLTLVLGSVTCWGRSGGTLRRIAAVCLLYIGAQPFIWSAGAWKSEATAALAQRSSDVAPAGVRAAADYLEANARPGSVVLSDPVTSYALSAFADVRVVALLHQHGTPYDPDPFGRLAGARAVYSAFVPLDDAMAAIRRWRVDYVVLNGNYPGVVRDYLADWDPGWVTAVREKLQALQGAEVVYQEGSLWIYRLGSVSQGLAQWHPAWPLPDRAPGPLAPCEPPSQSALRVIGTVVQPHEVVPGETLSVTLGYRREGEVDSPLPLKVYIRLDDHGYFMGRQAFPGEKHVRRYWERRTGQFHRWRFEHVPFDGALAADSWPLGQDLFETIPLRVPLALSPGDYEVRIMMVHDPLISNFAIRDFLYDRDSYSGTVCGRLIVSRTVSR